MKKVKLVIFSMFVSGTVLFNISLLANKPDVLSNLNLASLQQALGYDLEEVIITCSSGGIGQCYTWIGGYCYFDIPPWDMWSDCEYSGCTTDYCDVIFDDCGLGHPYGI